MNTIALNVDYLQRVAQELLDGHTVSVEVVNARPWLDKEGTEIWGQCSQPRKGHFLIELSPVLLDERRDQLGPTFFHECAHAYRHHCAPPGLKFEQRLSKYPLSYATAANVVQREAEANHLGQAWLDQANGALSWHDRGTFEDVAIIG